MQRHSHWVWLLLAGCSPSTLEPTHPAPDDSDRTSTAALGPEHPDPRVPRPLIVAGEDGIFELSLAGETIRKLSATAARSPRWTAGGSQLVFIGLEGGRADLRRLDLENGAEEVVAPIDFGPGCVPDASEEGEPDGTREALDLTNEDELWVAADDRYVCLVAADHSGDLRDVAEVHVFDLLGDSAERVLLMAMPDCGRGAEQPMPAQCTPATGGDAEAAAAPTSAEIGGYVESTAPGGAWQLVHLADALGDVVHVQYALVEVTTGQSFTVGGEAGPWPAPRIPPKAAQVEHGEGDWIEGWPDIADGTRPLWVGPNHLVVGHQLLVAGERVVDLPGDLAI